MGSSTLPPTSPYLFSPPPPQKQSSPPSNPVTAPQTIFALSETDGLGGLLLRQRTGAGWTDCGRELCRGRLTSFLRVDCDSPAAPLLLAAMEQQLVLW